MKKQYCKQIKSIKQVEANNEKLFNSKLNDTEKERIRKYIDKNIGQLKERFCPHEFFQLVSRYQDKFFSNKEIRKIRRKYKRYKLNIFEDKYINLYEEYFYKSKYFMYYFKTKIKKNYFDKTAQQLYEDYKYGFELNIKIRSKTLSYIFKFISYIFTFIGGIFTPFIVGLFGDDKVINARDESTILDLYFIISVIIVGIIIMLSREFEKNAYDTRLFRKLLQDEFDNN